MIKFSDDNFTIKEADNMTLAEADYYYAEFGARLEKTDNGHFVMIIPTYDMKGFAAKMKKILKKS